MYSYIITLFLILFYFNICVDFLGTHMTSLIFFFRKSGVIAVMPSSSSLATGLALVLGSSARDLALALVSARLDLVLASSACGAVFPHLWLSVSPSPSPSSSTGLDLVLISGVPSSLASPSSLPMPSSPSAP
jgi:hypothetical protein